MSKRVEFIKFRYIICPDCSHQLCWINPRLPNYCPECGSSIFAKLKTNPESIIVVDDTAELHSYASGYAATINKLSKD